MSINIFEAAARSTTPIRFRTDKHSGLTVEDLCRLPLTKLNEAGKDIHARLLAAESTNFLTEARPANATDVLMMDIVKYLIKVKQEENTVRTAAKVRASKNAVIRELIEDKKNEKLKSMDVEELEKLIEE